MKKLVYKIMGVMSFTLMYLFIFPVNVFAAEEKKVSVDVEAIKDVFKQLFDLIEGQITIIGIALVLPAIICLLLAYRSDKRSNGGRGILGLVWTSILLMIPVVSLVMLFIWAFGEKTKSDPTFRNFARLVLLTYLYGILFAGTYYLASMFLIQPV